MQVKMTYGKRERDSNLYTAHIMILLIVIYIQEIKNGSFGNFKHALTSISVGYYLNLGRTRNLVISLRPSHPFP
jgi:hypothetical protein